MPLILKSKEPPQKEQLRIRLEKNILSEIQAYCEWTDILVDYFLEQAASFVLRKDKEWHERKKQADIAVKLSV